MDIKLNQARVYKAAVAASQAAARVQSGYYMVHALAPASNHDKLLVVFKDGSTYHQQTGRVKP